MGNFTFLISSGCDYFYKSCRLKASNKQENKGDGQSEKNDSVHGVISKTCVPNFHLLDSYLYDLGEERHTLDKC